MIRTSHLALGAAAALIVSLVPAAPVTAGLLVASETPEVGDCLFDTDRSTWDPLVPATRVDCSEEHTAEVTYLGAYPDDLPKPSEVGYDIYAYEEQMCPYPEAVNYFTKVRPRISTRVTGTFKVPTDDQWADGDRTVVCLAVSYSGEGSQQSWKGSLPKLLAGPGFVEFLGCQSAKPKTGVWIGHSECTSKKQWLLVTGVKVKGKATSKPYPGKAVQASADKACKKKAKKYTKKNLKLTFIASVAPVEYWNEGVRFAECLIPYSHYNGKR